MISERDALGIVGLQVGFYILVIVALIISTQYEAHIKQHPVRWRLAVGAMLLLLIVAGGVGELQRPQSLYPVISFQDWLGKQDTEQYQALAQAYYTVMLPPVILFAAMLTGCAAIWLALWQWAMGTAALE